MCILCVIQKWSRRIATMLPWLVFPLIGLWFLSQFLPPAFRFEITSPRLACVFVLLITLFWYEILMPQLSAWRVQRNARLRERKRSEAIEMQKLRKTATRLCRNCLVPYRDQNPGGGKFMCSYCGHISKRPVLDLPIPPGLRISNSGILKDLVGKGGKKLNGKVWSDNGWICGQDWLENSGGWVGGSVSVKYNFRGKNNGFSCGGGGDDHCFAEKSYSRLVFLCKILAVIFLGIMWLWRKIFKVSSSNEDTLADGDIAGLPKKGENGGNCNESKSEKARRKAEEKRQARLEREQLEEEERKQREEVARLVEERRKLRDEKTNAEKDHAKTSPCEKNNKKETERKRQEKKKEKDRGSSKSNSDVDELEKRAVKEIERSKNQRIGSENLKFNSNDTIHGSKIMGTHSSNFGNVGTRYLDRMRGSFLSSSRAFTNGGFFGKGTTANTNSTREHKPIATLDHAQHTASRREIGKSNASPADDNTINCPVQVVSQPAASKKSWQQLFTRTPTVPSSSSPNVISRPKANSPKEVQTSMPSSGYQATQGLDNPITFELPYTLPNLAYGDPIVNTSLPLSSNSTFPPDKYLSEESDIFEDPCYVPDPVLLIGPVSESLDNFQLDLGFIPDLGLQKPHPIVSSEVSRPSPIESPISRLRILDNKHANINVSLFKNTHRAQDMNSLPTENYKGWQVWDSSPLYQDSLGLAGDPSSWLLPSQLNGSNKEGVMHPQSQKPMASLFKKDDQKTTYGCQVHATDDDPWMQRTSYGSMLVSDSHLLVNNTTQNGLVYGSPNGSAINHQFQLSQANFWAKKERVVEGKASASSSTTRPVGGLYSTSYVQSLW